MVDGKYNSTKGRSRLLDKFVPELAETRVEPHNVAFPDSDVPSLNWDRLTRRSSETMEGHTRKQVVEGGMWAEV